jgi:hypothetical protein
MDDSSGTVAFGGSRNCNGSRICGDEEILYLTPGVHLMDYAVYMVEIVRRLDRCGQLLMQPFPLNHTDESMK